MILDLLLIEPWLQALVMALAARAYLCYANNHLLQTVSNQADGAGPDLPALHRQG
jgi:hypothetical protein